MGAGGYVQISDCLCGFFATVTVLIAGHSLGALMYLKLKLSTAATPQ